MASIDITCPECKKQLKGPDELIGKKIRCKSCKATFTVKGPKTAASSKQAAGSAQAKGGSAQQQSYQLEDEEGKNPYKMTDVLHSTRCPQCAADMEEGGIICLNCGYNTQTRIRTPTIRTYEKNIFDWIIWLTPGIICVALVLAMIATIVWFWIPAGLRRLAHVGEETEAWWGHFSLRIYGTVFCALAIWKCGMFAFRRLILHATPPEKLKR